jgi:F0F1-type ATP synthase membrane subunit b/b'
MKSRVGIATIFATLLWPALAFAAAGGEESGSWSALIFYAINFALFIWVIKRYGGPLITKFFSDRAANIRETLSRSESNFTEAQELANRAAQRMATLEAEKQQITSDLADETVFQIQRVYELAQETVARIRRDTATTASALREAGQRSLRQALAEASGTLARELLARNFEAADQHRMLEGFIEKLGDEARR